MDPLRIPERCMCGDPYCPSCFPGGVVELDRPESQEELLTLLRERMPHKTWDDYWQDAFISESTPGGWCHDMWLERIFDRVRDDDFMELGRQVHEVRQSIRKRFIDAVDPLDYGIYWEDQE